MKPSLREALQTFLADNYGLAPGEVDQATPLFSSRLLDSFVLIELVAYIERREQVRFKPSSFSLENFDTIDRMVTAVAAMKGIEV